jgi:hypothetical protein
MDGDFFCYKSMKLSNSLQFKIEKIIGGQPMLNFASYVWVTIDINPCKFYICCKPYLLVAIRLFNLGQDPSK